MRVFVLIEVVAVIVFIWLMANILRYLFFKRHGGGIFFGLSDGWLGGRPGSGRRSEQEQFKAEDPEEGAGSSKEEKGDP